MKMKTTLSLVAAAVALLSQSAYAQQTREERKAETAGAVKSGETMKAGEGGPDVAIGVPEQMRNMAAMIIPLQRAAQPEEAAAPVLFLASPMSNYIHGQVINVTGGQFGGMYG